MIASNEAFVEEKAEQAHWYWNGVIKYALILISKTGVGEIMKEIFLYADPCKGLFKMFAQS